MSHKDLLNFAVKQLEENSIYTGFSRVLMLEMMQALGMDMFALMDEDVSPEFKDAYLSNIDQLCQDIPLGYVLGYEWFYGYKLKVNPSVLIPRGETEELVGHVLEDIDRYFESPVIADVACGSGAIGLALSLELNLPVTSTDISKEALEVAQENNDTLGAQLTILEGDMLEPLGDMQLDVLVCNPPYIKNTEHIQSAVLSNEPHIALFGGDDGLYFYKKVFDGAHKVMKPRSMMAFEIGFDIGDALLTLARKQFPEARVELKQDMNGLDRMLFVYFGIEQRP